MNRVTHKIYPIFITIKISKKIQWNSLKKIDILFSIYDKRENSTNFWKNDNKRISKPTYVYKYRSYK